MNWEEFYAMMLEEVDPDKYHKQMDDESWFYKDQRKRYLSAKRKGKPISYRIDPERDKRNAAKKKDK